MEAPIPGRGLRVGDLIELRVSGGIPRHGRIMRIFRSVKQPRRTRMRGGCFYTR